MWRGLPDGAERSSEVRVQRGGCPRVGQRRNRPGLTLPSPHSPANAPCCWNTLEFTGSGAIHTVPAAPPSRCRVGAQVEGSVHQARGNAGAALQCRAVVAAVGGAFLRHSRSLHCDCPTVACRVLDGSLSAAGAPTLLGVPARGQGPPARAVHTCYRPLACPRPHSTLQPLHVVPRTQIHKPTNQGERKKPRENGELKNGIETITVGQP